MKTFILTIATFLTLNLSAQNMTPVTSAEVNEINLRLDGLDKFGKQHRTGNHLMIAGTLLNGFGLLFLNSNTAPANGQSKLTDDKLALGTLAVGTILSTTGLIINIDSFRHLRNDK